MKKINENEFYEIWRRYKDVINSLPVEERGNFGGYIMLMYQEVMRRRKRFCDILEKNQKIQCNMH